MAPNLTLITPLQQCQYLLGSLIAPVSHLSPQHIGLQYAVFQEHQEVARPKAASNIFCCVVEDAIRCLVATLACSPPRGIHLIWLSHSKANLS